MFCSLYATYAQKQWVLQSRFLAKQDTVLTFIPEGEQETKYPTVILLHGYGANYKQWNKIADLQTLANRYQMILVCPDGLRNSWYIDVPNKQQQHYEQFFFTDFIPSIFRELPAEASQLFITGYSMGGHGAIRFFLRKPNLFTAAASSSGVLDLKCSGFRKTDLKQKLGVYDSQKWSLYTAIGQISTKKQIHKPIFIDCGLQDHLLPCNREFVTAARKAKLDVSYLERNGKHNGAYWQKAIHLHLAFFSETLKRKK